MKKKHILYATNFIIGVLAALIFFLRDTGWLLVVLFIAILVKYKIKPELEEEKEDLENFSIMTFAGTLLLPGAIFLLGTLFFIGYTLMK